MDVKMLRDLKVAERNPALPQRFLKKGKVYNNLSNFIVDLVIENKYGEEDKKPEEDKEKLKKLNELKKTKRLKNLRNQGN